MSTILKALRRLEEDRTSSGARPLREEVATAPREVDPPRRRRWLAGALAVLLVLAAGVAARQLWSGRSSGSSDVAAEASPAPGAPGREAGTRERAATPPRPSRTPASAVRRPPASSAQEPDGLPEEAFASPVEVVERPPMSPRVPIEIARAADPLPTRSAADAPSTRSASAPVETPQEPGAQSTPSRVSDRARRAASPPTPAVEQAPPPAPTRKAAPRAPAPLAKTPTSPAPAPALVAKAPSPARAPLETPSPSPAPTRAAPPPAPPVEKPTPIAAADASAARAVDAPGAVPRVEKTLWHPKPERRVAFLAMGGDPAQRFQEGDVIGRFVVSEIQPSGVVFLEDGKPIQRKIGD